MSENKTPAAAPNRNPRGHGGPPWAGAGMPAEKAMNFGSSAKRLLGLLAPHRWGMIVVLLFTVASVVLSVLGPKLLGEGTNLVFYGAFGDGIDFTALGWALTGVLVLYVFASLFGWLQAFILNTIVQKTIYNLRERVQAKLARLPLSYFDRMQRGELLSRVTNDIDNISQSLQQTVSQVLTSLLTVIGVVGMMFIISPWLALIALVSIPLTVVIVAQVAKRSQKQFVAQWKHTGELNGHIEETFSGHALVKVFGRQKESEQHFDDKNEELFKASFGAQFVSGIIMPATMFVGNLVFVAIAVVGGLFVVNGTMRLGDVQAFIQYARQFSQPLSQLGSMANLLQSGVASAERVFELLDAEEQSAEPVSNQSLPAGGSGRLVFENASFHYQEDTPLIDDLSLIAEPGQTVAIVGPTGAGKTTLVNLIMRFYELDSGRITLDGIDIASLSREQLRRRTGMVLQDTWLFRGTIRENIAYGRPDATEEEIQDAAQASYVDRFVRSLPDGYDTVLEDEAANLSAGERQLLTIARAFIARPSVLILDEATSSVDTRTELLIQHAMISLRKERTSFVIAHRLSTIRDADLILVMESGRIVEQGTHTELLTRGGAYYRLYQAQFAAPAETELDEEPVPGGLVAETASVPLVNTVPVTGSVPVIDDVPVGADSISVATDSVPTADAPR